jgi:ketosteroid isomerase-like protein
MKSKILKDMKRNIIILLCLLLAFACQKEINQSVENEKLIRQFFENFNKHDYAKMASMYVENAEFKDPSLGKGIIRQTRKQTIKKYQELNNVFPDIHDEIQNIYPSGNNQVIVEFISSGTALDKSKFELPICTIFTIENGMITKDFTYFDNFEEPK